MFNGERVIEREREGEKLTNLPQSCSSRRWGGGEWCGFVEPMNRIIPIRQPHTTTKPSNKKETSQKFNNSSNFQIANRLCRRTDDTWCMMCSNHPQNHLYKYFDINVFQTHTHSKTSAANGSWPQLQQTNEECVSKREILDYPITRTYVQTYIHMYICINDLHAK